MTFPCEVEQHAGGWTLRHQSEQVGSLTVTSATRDAALEKMRGEIRYRLELCPCSGESYRHIDVEIAERS